MEDRRNTIVINLFGGPGSGKSTTAAGLFYFFKLFGLSCELCTEWIKECVYEERKEPFDNQIYTFAKQHKRLLDLDGKVDFIITDSPILLSSVYGQHVYEKEQFDEFVLLQFSKFHNYSVFLQRPINFEESGRVHDEKTSKQKDKEIRNLLKSYGITHNYIETSVNTISEILHDFYKYYVLEDTIARENKAGNIVKLGRLLDYIRYINSYPVENIEGEGNDNEV